MKAVEIAWAALQQSFIPIGDPTDDPAQAVEQMRANCAAVFARHLGPSVAQHFVIPEAYRAFLIRVGRTVQRGGIYGMTLYDAASVASATIHGCDLFAEGRPDNAMMALEIGHWSDKHDLFLICDTRHPRHGAVLDGHDDHPWLDTHALSPVALDIVAFLRTLSRR